MGKNVILLTIDALRSDHIHSYGYERETTPFLDKFTDQATKFKYAWAPSSHTRESIPAILTGELPCKACTNDFQINTKTLATYLSDFGLKTGAFHSNPYASRAFGYGTDFDIFDDDLYLGNSRVMALAQRAYDKLRDRHYATSEEINERALKWIDSFDDRPFFLWNHYMDVHGPYEPPVKYWDMFTDEKARYPSTQKLYRRAAIDGPSSISESEKQMLIDLYDGEIRSTDSSIESFIENLEERNILDNSIVIITADHGDAFGENGFFGHPRRLESELIKVPLLVYGGGFDQSLIKQPVSLLQLVPSILSNIGANGGREVSQTFNDQVHDGTNPTIPIASVRGEGPESHIIKFAAFKDKKVGYLHYSTDNNSIIQKDYNSDSVRERLESVLREACEGSIGGQNDQEVDVGYTVKDRLEALGYK